MPQSGAYVGQVVRFSCVVIFLGAVNGTPTFSWRAPQPVPTTVVSSPREGAFTSDFVIDSFNSSHEGTYICEVSGGSLPYSIESSTTIALDPTCTLRLHFCLSIANINFYCAVSLSVESSISVQSMEPLRFTLSCESTGGFPASVVWMKDSTVIEGGITTLRSDLRTYTHSLNASEEGFYTCIVSNDVDSANASLNATSE